VGIEREKIGVDYRWLCSPFMASLDMPSLSIYECPSKGLDFKSFQRDPFLKRFKLYVLKGLLQSEKFMLLPKSLERMSKSRITSFLK
jgi:hypothetical protein